jgi:hypothetical protein|tara:strand:- start:1169 stop:1303 length:135 start_codon:yes stop_codon:yes gene_type:complete
VNISLNQKILKPMLYGMCHYSGVPAILKGLVEQQYIKDNLLVKA